MFVYVNSILIVHVSVVETLLENGYSSVPRQKELVPPLPVRLYSQEDVDVTEFYSRVARSDEETLIPRKDMFTLDNLVRENNST